LKFYFDFNIFRSPKSSRGCAHFKSQCFTSPACIICLLCADKPSAPQGPLEAVETTPNAIKLQWKPPKDDGGSKIDHYVLEKKPKGSNKWTKCPGHIDPDETEATAKNLEEGQEYDFRVVAVNKEGESDPLVTTAPIKAKYPFGRSLCILFLY